VIRRGERAQPAASRRRAPAAVAALAALALAACSSPPPTQFPGGIAIPAGASGLRDHVDDQLRTMTGYYRFELPPSQLPAFAAALHCALGEVETGPRAAREGDPDWFAPRPAQPHRSCESSADGWIYELEVDVSRPERYTVYLAASS
jgi:hypothetical protein